MENLDSDIIVIGAGGHAVVVADALLAAGRKVLGFVDVAQLYTLMPSAGQNARTPLLGRSGAR